MPLIIIVGVRRFGRLSLWAGSSLASLVTMLRSWCWALFLPLSNSLALPPGNAWPHVKRMPRNIVFSPSPALNEQSVLMAKRLDEEIKRSLAAFERKQERLSTSEDCMAAYVKSPMAEKAASLDAWSKLVMDHLELIPEGAESATLVHDGVPVTVRFDRAKYATPREEAAGHSDMAAKLWRQQAKVDALRHRNEGTEAALRGWQKRVRIAVARGEVAALCALQRKLIGSSKRLGLRASTLESDTDLGI